MPVIVIGAGTGGRPVGFGTAARNLPADVTDLRGQQVKDLLVERTVRRTSGRYAR